MLERPDIFQKNMMGLDVSSIIEMEKFIQVVEAGKIMILLQHTLD